MTTVLQRHQTVCSTFWCDEGPVLYLKMLDLNLMNIHSVTHSELFFSHLFTGEQLYVTKIEFK